MKEHLERIASMRKGCDIIGKCQHAGKAWSFASDGWLLVAVSPPVTERIGARHVKPTVIESIMHGYPSMYRTIDCARLRSWAADSRMVKCDCGHVHQCTTPKMDDDIPIARGWIDDMLVNRYLLAELLESAPPGPLLIDMPVNREAPIRIRSGENWLGVIEPLRIVGDADEAAAPRITLPEEK